MKSWNLTQGAFLINYLKIPQKSLWRRNCFMFSLKPYNDYSHTPWRPCLRPIKIAWRNLKEGWHKVTQGTFLQNYLRRILLKFLLQPFKDYSHTPWWPCQSKLLEEIWKRHKEHFYKIIWGEHLLSFHCRPYFSTNQHGLNTSDIGSCKKHFFKTIWK